MLFLAAFIVSFYFKQILPFHTKLLKSSSYKHYTVQDGLAQMQVMTMFTDSKGYLWCTTKAGLSRFDGYRFKNYPKAILPGFDLTVFGETKDQRLLLFGPNSFAELVGDSILNHNYPGGKKSSSLLKQSQRFKQKILIDYSPDSEKRLYVMDYSDLNSIKLYNVNPEWGPVIFLEEGKQN